MIMVSFSESYQHRVLITSSVSLNANIIKSVGLTPFLCNLHSLSKEGGEADGEDIVSILSVASVVGSDMSGLIHLYFLSFYITSISNNPRFVKNVRKIKRLLTTERDFGIIFRKLST